MILVNLFDHSLDHKDFDKQIYVMELMFVYHEYKMFDLIREYRFHHDDLNRHLNLLIPIDWLNLTKNKDNKIFRLSRKQ